MKIFKAELWNLDALLSLFEQYRLTHNMMENPERTLIFYQTEFDLVKVSSFSPSIISKTLSALFNSTLAFLHYNCNVIGN